MKVTRRRFKALTAVAVGGPSPDARPEPLIPLGPGQPHGVRVRQLFASGKRQRLEDLGELDALSLVERAVRGSGQPVRQHFDLAQVPAAHPLRGVLPGLVVPTPVLLLIRVDPVTLQQVRFRPDQPDDCNCR